MTNLKKFLAGFVLVAAAPLAQAQDWRQSFETNTSEFSSGITLMGSARRKGDTDDNWTVIIFGTVLKATGEAVAAGYALKNTYFAKSARMWDRAATSDAETLKVNTEGRERRLCNSTGCFIDEHINISLPMDTLRKAAKEDMRIRVTGSGARTGEYILAIDRNEAQALLNGFTELARPPQK